MAAAAPPLPIGHAGPPVALPVVVTEDFADLFRYHYPRLVRALRLAGAGREEAEDVAQEAFARTLSHWPRVRTGSNPPGYVFRVAFRLLHRRGMLPGSPLDEAVPTPAGGPDEVASVGVDVERALGNMPPRRRACVILCWLLDLPTAEVSEALDIAPGTVRKQLELARPQLRGDLTP